VEAERRRLELGGNDLVPKERHASQLRALAHAAHDPMVILLAIAAAAYLAIGEREDATIVIVALVVIAAVTWALERRTEHAVQRLERLAAPVSRAWRDGSLQIVPAKNLVQGDCILIRSGDLVPADAMLSEGSVTVDESTLTGESAPIKKQVTGSDESAHVFAGTTVLMGRAMAVVVATGRRTRYGRVSTLVATIRRSRTPLQRAIGHLVLRLGAFAGVCCLVVIAAEVAHGTGWAAAALAGVSLAIAAVPEEFPTVYALYLSLGAWRLARHHALVRDLAAVETLGSVTVICLDKTGTLTSGDLSVVDGVEVTREGIQPLSASADGGHAVRLAAARASDAHAGDAFDTAILRDAAAAGTAHDDSSGDSLVLGDSFDPHRRFVRQVWHTANDRFVSAAKGALEPILELAAVSDIVRQDITSHHARLARAGYRVLAVAMGEASDTAEQALAEPLAFRGLLAFGDRPRPEVPPMLEACRRAGVRVIMLTGDAPETAIAIARQIGLAPAECSPAILGREVDAAADHELAGLLRRGDVFARVDPEQKFRLVQALRRSGDIVAMIGDGVNDAPALRAADIGVALGEQGTAVASQAATLVLLDDNVATIAVAIRDGRRIFDNLRMAFSYLIAFHVPLLLSAFILPLAGAPLLLLPIQLVWFELIVHPTAALVFETEPAAATVMDRPPRAPRSRVLDGTDLLRPIVTGLVLVIGVLGLFLGARAAGSSDGTARTMAIGALLIGQVGLVLSARAGTRAIWHVPVRGNPLLLPVLIGTIGTLLGAVSVPVIRAALQLVPLTGLQWSIVLTTAVISVGWREPVKAWRGVHGAR